MLFDGVFQQIGPIIAITRRIYTALIIALIFESVYLEKVGQVHDGIHYSKWHHSMANIDIYEHHHYAFVR